LREIVNIFLDNSFLQLSLVFSEVTALGFLIPQGSYGNKESYLLPL